jgi:uncharacterized membrane protein
MFSWTNFYAEYKKSYFMELKISNRSLNSIPIIVWILAISFIGRLPFIFRPLKGDEFLTFKGIKVSFCEIIPYLGNPANHDPYPPFFYWIMHIWNSFFPNPIWNRLLLVIIGTMGVYFTYRTGSVLKNKKLGLLAALLMAFNPQAIWADQWIRAYSIAALLGVITGFTYLKSIKSNNYWVWLTYFLCGSLLLYTFYFGAIILIVLGLHFLFFVEKGKRKWLVWIITQILIIVSFAPWLSKIFSQFKGSSGVLDVIEKRGFWLGDLHIGVLPNGWLGTFGLDSLWNPAPIKDLSVTFIIIFLFLIFSVIYLNILGWAKSLSEDKELTLSVVWISIMPALVGFVIHQITNFPVVHHYYVIVCWSGAIALALSIFNLNGSHRFALISLLIVIYIWRIIDLYFLYIA